MVKTILRTIILFLLAIGICMSVSYAGSLYMTPSVPAWYDHLKVPDPTVPSWLFGPVWTVLYVLMGLSLFLVLTAGIHKKDVYLGLTFFLAQLACSFAWIYVFFGLHSLFIGLIAAVLLWFILLITMIQLFRFTVPGGAVLIPVFLWATLLIILNYAVLSLNPLSSSIL